MIAALIIGMGALALIGGLIWVANNSGKGTSVHSNGSGDGGLVAGSSAGLHHHDENCGHGDSSGGDGGGDSGGGGDGGGGGGSD